MIWRPRPGQRVKIRYRAKSRGKRKGPRMPPMPYRGRLGTVTRVSRGRRFINVEILLDTPGRRGERHVVIPRGNLIARSH